MILHPLNQAYELFTRSARSFPDSWVAKECHEYRSAILLKMGKVKEGKRGGDQGQGILCQ